MRLRAINTGLCPRETPTSQRGSSSLPFMNQLVFVFPPPQPSVAQPSIARLNATSSTQAALLPLTARTALAHRKPCAL